MKTIAELAKESGVSRQAVYRRLSALPSETLSTNNKGVQLINAEGEALLKTILSEKVSSEQSADSPDSSADNVTDTLISMLQKELEEKNKLIAEQQQTIRELAASNKSLSQSINADRHNELAETIIDGQTLPKLSDTKQKSRLFWQFWKK